MEKIILDCDPGHDDAIAILLLPVAQRHSLIFSRSERVEAIRIAMAELRYRSKSSEEQHALDIKIWVNAAATTRCGRFRNPRTGGPVVLAMGAISGTS